MCKLMIAFLAVLTITSCEINRSKSTPENQDPELLEDINTVNSKKIKAPKPFFDDQDTVGKTKIIVDKLKYDLGEIVSGEIVDCGFTVTNVGANPLNIIIFTTSGGGLYPQSTHKDPIPVGERCTFHLKFNTKGKRGKQSKTAKIVANTIPAITTVEFISDIID